MNGLARLPHGSLVQFGAVLGAVVVLCMLAAGLSAFGLPGHLVAYLFVFFGLVVVAVLCRHNTPNSVKGSGVAVSVEWLSAFGLFGIIGAVYVHGHDGLAILLGLVAGFVVSLLAIAPRLSRISAPSMPDFLEVRYESEALRYITLGVLTVVTMLFLAAQLAASGLIAVHIFQIPSVVGICVGAVVILALAISARRGTISSAQIIMAVTAIASVLLAGTWLLSAKTGIVVPHLAAGGLYSDIAAAETRLDLDARFADPFNGFGVRVAQRFVSRRGARDWISGYAASGCSRRICGESGEDPTGIAARFDCICGRRDHSTRTRRFGTGGAVSAVRQCKK